MIKDKGFLPYVVYRSNDFKEFEDGVHRNISLDITHGILEDCMYGIQNASVTYLSNGDFRVIAHAEDVDLETVCEYLNEIINEYEVLEYL